LPKIAVLERGLPVFEGLGGSGFGKRNSNVTVTLRAVALGQFQQFFGKAERTFG
jgi:hypothetical protein